MTVAPASTCVHHWRINEPDGSPAVPGTCHRCGAARMFRASGEDDLDWGGAAATAFADDSDSHKATRAKRTRKGNKQTMTSLLTRRTVSSPSKAAAPPALPEWLTGGGWRGHPAYAVVAAKAGEINNRLSQLERELTASAEARRLAEEELAEAEIGELTGTVSMAQVETARATATRAADEPRRLQGEIETLRRAQVILATRLERAAADAHREAMAALQPHILQAFGAVVDALRGASVLNDELRRLRGIMGDDNVAASLAPAFRELVIRPSFDPAPYTLLDRGNLTLLEFAIVRLRDLQALQ